MTYVVSENNPVTPKFESNNFTQHNYSSGCVKGSWTGDYFEFDVPVRRFEAGTEVTLTFPAYGRGAPLYWDVYYLDGEEWKCDRSSHTSPDGQFTQNSTLMIEHGNRDGSFEAKVPAEYGERNKLFILYPSDGLEGLNVDKMKMELPAEQHQDTLGSTRGVVVPMYAVADIPGEGVNTMKVRYEFPAATLRFRIESQEHKLEKVLSVTMTAQDPIGGSMIFSRPSNVIKPVSEVKVVVDKPATIEKGGYLYMKVMRGTYSNVTVAVTTDQNTYLFKNGTFDLTDPDASLFKVNLSLDAGKVEPKTLYYKEISEGEVFTADAKYLIARKRSDTEYHVAASFSTYYLDAVAFEADENGIEATSDVSQYAFTIAPVEGTEYVTLYSEAVSNSAPSAMHGKGYVGSPATSYVDPGHFVRGSEEEDFDNPAAPLRYYWKITFEDGLPVIGSVQVDDYRIVYELWGMQFAPCKSSNTDTEPIVILKLEE